MPTGRFETMREWVHDAISAQRNELLSLFSRYILSLSHFLIHSELHIESLGTCIHSRVGQVSLFSLHVYCYGWSDE